MDKSEVIKSKTEVLLEKMAVPSTVTVTVDSDVFAVQIDNEEMASLLIGKHGMTIRSLQTVLEAMLYREFGEKVELIVNVGDYRQRQKERIESLAETIAQRVTAEGRPASLPSFSAYERKLVHEYIGAKHHHLTSYSEGEGRDRKLVIKTKDDKDTTNDSV